MKRQKKAESTKEKATYFEGKGGIEFTLIPDMRKFPKPEPLVPLDYDGYYQGDVLIVSAPLSPEIVGLTAHLISFRRLPFCAPYHVYHCPGGISLDAKGVASGVDRTMCLIKGGPLCRVSRYKDRWSRSDVQYAFKECKFSHPAIMEPIARARLQKLKYPLPLERVLRFEWFVQNTLIGKGPLLSQLFEPFLSQRWDEEKDRHRFVALSFQQCQDLLQLYREEPWELAWKTIMDNRFGKVKHISFQHYQDAMRGKAPPSDEIRISLSLLWKMRDRQRWHSDTLFGVDQMGPLLSGVPLIHQTPSLERRVYDYCMSRDMVCFPDEGLFAFRDDYHDATTIIRSLKDMKEHQQQQPFSLRMSTVPTKPPRLTNDQYRIAQHITQHWISIVLGSPGTGKTAIITWLLSHYQRALAVGFVGMLVKMLQRRNGRRRELAYTIDHLRCCVERHGEEARQWLAYFEVLVIDECSNVSMGRMSKLFSLFPNLRKIVFVGDTEQLKSMNAGDALTDLVKSFPVHCFRLTENLRVAPDLKTLQDVPGHILNTRLACIQWAPKAWEAPVSNPVACISMTPSEMIKALYAKLLLVDPSSATQLLDTQFLVLTHDGPYGRKAVNGAIQKALEDLGILKRPQSPFTLYKDCAVYEGCKITFKKNYNHPIEKDFGSFKIRSDPVANGELSVIRSIERVQKPGHGILMKICDSSDATPDSFKSVWIEETEGVNPFHIQLGNAITVYSSQGREFLNVVFCVEPKPSSHWTKANVYVASSRAQRRFLLMGPRAEFNTIAGRPNAERRTIFQHLLKKEKELLQHVANSTNQETIVRDPETLTVLSPKVLAVPMFREK